MKFKRRIKILGGTGLAALILDPKLLAVFPLH